MAGRVPVLSPLRQFLRTEADGGVLLLAATVEGDPALAIRGDEAEECWRIVEPMVAEWDKGTPRLLSYPAGSAGPEGRTVA